MSIRYHATVLDLVANHGLTTCCAETAAKALEKCGSHMERFTVVLMKTRISAENIRGWLQERGYGIEVKNAGIPQ